MRVALVVIGIIVLILVGGIIWGIGVNNQLVQAEQVVNEKWAQVQNVYQRRADLIPNLVETVKGYAAQERTVLEEVTKARASVAGIKATPELVNDPEAFRKFQAAQQELSGALARLLVTVERYPDLKSNQNFLTLQSQLEGTENRIAVERMRYSEAVRVLRAGAGRCSDARRSRRCSWCCWPRRARRRFPFRRPLTGASATTRGR